MLMACWGMALAIIGDYLLGFGTFTASTSPDAYMGIEWSVAPDWRYAVSSILGFCCVPLFAVAVIELCRVLEAREGVKDSRVYKAFKAANWCGVFYFAFIHIAICMLPVIFNAGMEATGDTVASAQMVMRVLKSIAVPMGAGFILCDLMGSVAWIGLVISGKIPVKKIALICNPVVIALLGQLTNYIVEGLDAGFESLGWLLMYLVCALSLTEGRKTC